MATEDRSSKHSPDRDRDENRDPITGAPGAHPVGAGLGAAGGGAAGAAIGAIGGPIGAVVGAAVGGIAGGLLGKGVAEGINPTVEHEYWEKHYADRPYVTDRTAYAMYGPAYQYGWESYSTYRDQGRSFDEVEADLRQRWESHRSDSDLPWDRARPAVRDAWDRVADDRSRRP
jgi:hypothetical protein